MAKTSSLSGEPFAVGDTVESFLFRGAQGELERADLRPSEVPAWPMPEGLLCRWRHRVRERDDAEGDARRRSLATAEELFLALLEAGGEKPAEGADEAAEVGNEEAVGESARPPRERLIFLNLLALMLERRRVLKPIGRRPGLYRYMPEKRELRVPLVELDPAEVVPFIEELDALL
ncbi:MAG: hypothetical protein ACLFU2_11950 [Opitutales bacterium]